MTTAELSWVFLAVCAVATLLAGLSRNRVPVAVSIAIAAVLQIAFAALTSRRYTPGDVTVYFRKTAELLLQGKDPVHNMSGRQWNFLELMPAVHALELRSGLPWVYAVKIVPILCNLVLVALVARFAARDGRTRALQYAVNPVSLLVVALHGQVEPVALALALGGMLLVRKDRPVLGGILLGAAVAAKTWPVVILLAVLPLRNLPRAIRILLGAAVVPVTCLVLGVLFLDTQPITDLRHMASYSSYVAFWTWSAALINLGHKGMLGYASSLGPLGSALIAVGVATTLWLLRKRDPQVRVLGVLCAVLVCTSGFGPQYLLWVLPLMMALSGPVRTGYTIAAAGWAGVFYLSPFANSSINVYTLRALSWLPAALLLAVLIQLVRDRIGAPLAEQPADGEAAAVSVDASPVDASAPITRSEDPVTSSGDPVAVSGDRVAGTDAPAPPDR